MGRGAEKRDIKIKGYAQDIIVKLLCLLIMLICQLDYEARISIIIFYCGIICKQNCTFSGTLTGDDISWQKEYVQMILSSRQLRYVTNNLYII